MKKLIVILTISLACLYIVGSWAQDKTPMKMTDKELCAKVDSLVEVEQPLSAAPFIAEAKKRATAHRDTKWMLETIEKEIVINSRRMLREETVQSQISKNIEGAWTPLKQLLYLNLYQCDKEEKYAREALTDEAELRKIMASDIVSDKEIFEGMNLYDYIAMSLVMNMPTETESALTEEQLNNIVAPMATFANGQMSLPTDLDIVRNMARGAQTELSEILSHVLRIMQAEKIPAVKYDGEKMETLHKELSSLRPSNGSARAMVDFAQANDLINRASAMDNVREADEKIAEATKLYETVTKKLPKGYFRTLAQEQLNDIRQENVFIGSDGQVIPNKYVPIYLKYRNVGNITIRVYKVGKEYALKVEDDIQSLLDKKQLVETRRIDLPQTQPCIFLSSMYTELKGVGAGNYVVAAYADGKRNPMAVGTFISSGIAATRFTQNGQCDLLVQDFESGKAKTNVEISGESKPDIEGWVRLKERKGSRDVEIKEGDDIFSFDIGYTRGFTEERGDRSERRGQVITDRAIYRPGQKILFKAYVYDAWQDKMRAIDKNEEVSVTLRSANGQEIATQKLRTNTYGTISGEFDIPDDAYKGMGRIQILCKTRGNSYPRIVATTPIRIEDFKRTDNEITFDTFDEVLLPGCNVNVSGKCMSAAGLPVVGANVAYLVRPAYILKDDADVVGTTTTDSDGKFEFNFASDSTTKSRIYNIEIRLTDNRGETCEAHTHCNVNAQGSKIGLHVQDQVDLGNTPNAYINSTNFNGRPYKHNVHLRLEEYEPLTRMRPLGKHEETDTIVGDTHCVWGSDMLTANGLIVGKTVWGKDVEADGNTSFDIDFAFGAKKYKLTATTTSATGTELIETSDLYIVGQSGRAEHLPTLLVKTPEEVFAADTLRVRIGSGLERAEAFCVISYRSEIVKRERIDCSHGIGTFEYIVPADAVENESIMIYAIIDKDGRKYTQSKTSVVKSRADKLRLTLTTFRDHSTPGAKETWTLNTRPDTAVEIVASMYDSRLDKYVSNAWWTNFYRIGINNSLYVNGIQGKTPNMWGKTAQTHCHYNDYTDKNIRDNFLLSGIVGNMAYESELQHLRYRYGHFLGGGVRMYKTMSAGAANSLQMMDDGAIVEESAVYDEVAVESVAMAAPTADMAEAMEEEKIVVNGSEDDSASQPNNDYAMRENFAETVFFSPNITPRKDGSAEITFELPDNLTTYNFRAIAHDRSMRANQTTAKLTVSKAINVRLGLPRFLTEGDKTTISADVSVTDDNIKNAEAEIKICDAESGRELSVQKTNMSFADTRSQRIEAQVQIPEGVQEIKILAVAKAGQHNDGEQRTMPVRRRNLEIEESHTFVVFGSGKHKETNPFDNRTTQNLTFTYTSNAFIEVLRALPSLARNKYPSADTYLGIYETSAIATFLKQKPEIRKAVEYIKKNPEKQRNIADAEKTPWLYVAQNIRRHDKDIVNLFEGTNSEKQAEYALRKLSQMQMSNGGFAWFKGMDDSPWLTASIVSTIGELLRLGIAESSNRDLQQIVRKAVPYLDIQLQKETKRIAELREKNQKKVKPEKIFMSSLALETLYARALVDTKQTDEMKSLVSILKCAWQFGTTEERVTAATILTHVGEKEVAGIIVRSLEENLVQKDKYTAYVVEGGMYRRSTEIMSQSMMIITLSRLNPQSENLPKLINHLIVQKRGEAWPDVQSTSRAVLSLLASQSKIDSNDEIELDGEKVMCTVESPTFSRLVASSETIKNVVITKSNTLPSWGSWHRTALLPTDQMKADSTKALAINRTIETADAHGNWQPYNSGQTLHVGDKIRVSLTFYNDDALSFVKITDHRAATLEPNDKLSGYRGWWFWRLVDAELPTPPHYMIISDDKCEFFVDHLLEGWHSISYILTVTHAGDFAAGYAEAQCMYEPEIMAHTEGLRMRTE